MLYDSIYTYKNKWYDAIVYSELIKSYKEDNNIFLDYTLNIEGYKYVIHIQYDTNNLYENNRIIPSKITIKGLQSQLPIDCTIRSERHWESDYVKGDNVSEHDIYPFFCIRRYFEIKNLLSKILNTDLQ